MRRAAWLLAAVLAAAAAPAPVVAQAEDAPRYGQVRLPEGRTLQVEIADTPFLLARGYMFRDAVGPEDGMIFLFQREDIHTFWMKNVRFPLDMLWLSPDGTVVHLERMVPPCREDPCPSVVPLARALRVLELAGGRAAELGLELGTQLQVLLPPAP